MGEKLKPFTREQSRELEKVLPPDTLVQDLIDAFKDLISRESSHEKDINGPGLESKTTQALARSQLNAIEAAGTAAQAEVAAAEMAGTTIEDPERTLKETYLDKTLGAFKNVADKAHEWLRGYVHGLPTDKYGTTKTENFVEGPWFRKELPFKEVQQTADNVFYSLELNKKGAPWDLPAYLFQRFHSKPQELKAILSEVYEGATKTEKVGRVLERIRTSEHLTIHEATALIAEIKTLSDAELVSGDMGGEGTDAELDRSAETTLSMEFNDKLREVIESAVTPRLSGKKIITSTIATALAISVGMYINNSAVKWNFIEKKLLLSNKEFLLEDKEVFWHFVKDALNPFVQPTGATKLNNYSPTGFRHMVTKVETFNWAIGIFRSNQLLNAGS